jgi:hypothetical protein
MVRLRIPLASGQPTGRCAYQHSLCSSGFGVDRRHSMVSDVQQQSLLSSGLGCCVQ